MARTISPLGRENIRAARIAYIKQRFPTEVDRFWSKVDRRGPDECWLWTPKSGDNRYGRFHVVHNGARKAFKPNRYAYAISNGICPHNLKPEEFVCHTCDVPKCCNPRHLFLGNAEINMRDAIMKGRIKPKGDGNANSRLTEENVRTIRALFKPGDCYAAIGPIFNMTGAMISNIINRRNWTHI